MLIMQVIPRTVTGLHCISVSTSVTECVEQSSRIIILCVRIGNAIVYAGPD